MELVSVSENFYNILIDFGPSAARHQLQCHMPNTDALRFFIFVVRCGGIPIRPEIDEPSSNILSACRNTGDVILLLKRTQYSKLCVTLGIEREIFDCPRY